MTLIEALKSRRCLRNPDFEEGVWLSPDDYRYYFSVIEVLRDDWEIEEEKFEITRGQVEEVIRHFNSTLFIGTEKNMAQVFFDLLGIKL